MHVPPTEAVLLSGPEYVFAASQEATPETASVPANVTPIAALYQPFAFGLRAGVAVTPGAVASYFSANDRGATFPARSRQEPETDAEPVSGPVYVFAGVADVEARHRVGPGERDGERVVVPTVGVGGTSGGRARLRRSLVVLEGEASSCH